MSTIMSRPEGNPAPKDFPISYTASLPGDWARTTGTKRRHTFNSSEEDHSTVEDKTKRIRQET